jgi:anti-sigma-K factor RskA
VNGHENMRELVTLFALGTVDADEAAEVRAHLESGCDECRALLSANEAVAAELALLLPQSSPSAERRAQLLERVREGARDGGESGRGVTSIETARAPRRFAMPLALAASLLLLIGMGARIAGLRRTVDSMLAERDRVAADLADRDRAAADASRTRADLEQRLADAQAALDAITNPDMRPVSLSGKGDASAAKATAFLDAGKGRLLLYVNGLPPPAPGRTYQLWVIVEGKPVSLGVFDVEPNGRARMTAQQLPELRGPVTIAVTNEPAGGVPQPTGPMVLAGS